MSTPNITVKFLEPEEVDSIRAKNSEQKDEVPEIVVTSPGVASPGVASPKVESVTTASPDKASPDAASPPVERPKVSLPVERPKDKPNTETPNAASPKVEGSYKDNIACEESDIRTEKPQPPRVDSSAPETKSLEDHPCSTHTQTKAPAAKTAGKKLLGSAIDHSRRMQAEGGQANTQGNTRASAPVPRHDHSNKVGIGLMVAGIVGLLLTGRS